MSDELSIKQPPFKMGMGTRLTGLAAKKAAQREVLGEARVKEPEEMEHRLGILFDDSSSMGYNQMQDAIAGTEEFLRSCKAGETAVAIYPLNKEGLRLNINLPAVAIYAQGLRSIGGTPLVNKLNDMLSNNSLTRAIVFSDGEPNNYQDKDYEKILGFKVAVDTVYIPDGYVNERAEAFMKKLAEDTGGIYLRFERGKSNFRTAFKYLSPGLRHMLADKSFVAKLEGR